MALSGGDELSLQITVDHVNAVRNLAQVEKATEEVVKTAEKGDSVFQRFGGALAGVVAGVSVAGAVAFAKFGAEVADVSEAFDRFATQGGANSARFLEQLKDATANTVPELDLMKKSIEALRTGIKPDEFLVMTKAARALGEEGSSLEAEMAKLSRAFETGKVSALNNSLGILNIKAAQREYAESLGTTVSKLTETQKVEVARTVILAAMTKKAEEGAKVQRDLDDAFSSFEATVKNNIAALASSIATNKDVEQTFLDIADALRDIDFKPLIANITEAIAFLARFAVEFKNVVFAATDAVTGLADKARQLVSPMLADANAVSFFNKSIERVRQTLKDGHIERAAKQYDELARSINGTGSQALNNVLNPAMERLSREISGAIDGSDRFTKSVEQSAVAATKLGGAVDKMANSAVLGQMKQKLKDASKPLIKQGLETGKDTGNALAEGIITSVGSALGDGLSAVLEGSLSPEKLGNIGGSLGSSIGASIGEAIGGPAGRAIGEAIFKDLGENLGKGKLNFGQQIALALPTGGLSFFSNKIVKGLFGIHPDRQARHDVEKYFDELLDKSHLQGIIDGKLQDIEINFAPSGAYNDGSFDDAFSNLSASAQAAFQAVGTTIGELTGKSSELFGQIAVAVSDGLGGSLVNLQLLMAQTGLSAEQMGEAILNAANKGELSFLEAEIQLEAIEKLAAEGIPDAMGATDQAFENLVVSTAKGGAATIKAIKDLAVEAKEAGGKNVDDLAHRLVDVNHVAADQVGLIMKALADHGITTLDQLADASDRTVVAILSQLQASNFTFKEASDSVGDLVQKINDAPDEKTIVLNVRSNVDAGAAAVLGVPAGTKTFSTSRGFGQGTA